MSSDVFAKNKQLLRSRQLLQQQMKTELDERNQYLHDKSGGIVADILLAILLFVTLTASMFDMAAFYTAFSVLAAAILLKAPRTGFTAVRAVNARSDDPGKPGGTLPNPETCPLGFVFSAVLYFHSPSRCFKAWAAPVRPPRPQGGAAAPAQPARLLQGVLSPLPSYPLRRVQNSLLRSCAG